MSVLAKRRQAGPAPALPGAMPILAFLCDEETIETVCRVVPGGQRGAEVQEGGIVAARAALRHGATPSLLIVDLADCPAPVEEMAELTAICGARTTVLALGLENDVRLYRALLAVGVTDYLVKPVSGQDLRRTILTASRAEEQQEPSHRGRIAAVLGVRGGVGATSVAVGVAWVLANEHKKQVALVDLDLQFGTAALALDIEPGTGLRNALEDPDRIDPMFVASAMVSCSPNLFVLAAEEPLEAELVLQPPAVERLFKELRGLFDVVVVDLPRSLLGLAGVMLQPGDSLVVVSALSLAGLRDVLRIRTGIGKRAPDATLRIVANRAGLAKGSELGTVEFERGLGGKIDCVVPENPKAAKGALEGRPFVAAARGRTGAALRSLARTLGGIEAGRRSGWSWFRLKFGPKKK